MSFSECGSNAKVWYVRRLSDGIDELSNICNAIGGVAQLLQPVVAASGKESDLHMVDRENLRALLDILHEQFAWHLARLHSASGSRRGAEFGCCSLHRQFHFGVGE